MSKYLKLFGTTSEYETYINSSDKVLPNVSFCEDERATHYNPYYEAPKVVVNYNIPSEKVGEAISVYNHNYSVAFETMEVDGELLPSVPETITFETEGIHNIKFTLPEGGTTLKGFYGCGEIVSVKIPNIITTIDVEAFSNCSGLTSIEIPNSVTSIVGHAFTDCYGLTSIEIPNSVTSIGDGAFAGCSGLSSITSLAAAAPTIGDDAFEYIADNGTLYVPSGSSGYDAWMNKLPEGWTKVEQ